jgi:N-acetyl sugar amidotransferase
MDTSDPAIRFDGAGVCSYCLRARQLIPQVTWTAEDSSRALEEVASRIRERGVGQEYDSVIGLSGGVDSSYAALLAKQMRLRPLAVHFDNGWNSELAVENIQRIVEACGFDLQTVVINWAEFRDLQRAFLRASVVDIEVLTDHAISAATAQVAKELGIRFVLSGANTATEHGMPAAWHWDKGDWTNIRAIHQQYGSGPLRTYPHEPKLRRRLERLLGRSPTTVLLLDLVNYRRDSAAVTLQREFGWRDYGGKHHESTFTKFYQAVILPRKFGIDKRRVHLSDRIRNGEISRDMALIEIARPVYSPEELAFESDYVRKKLGFAPSEWDEIMSAPPRSHLDFPSDHNYWGLARLWLRRTARSVSDPR